MQRAFDEECVLMTLACGNVVSVVVCTWRLNCAEKSAKSAQERARQAGRRARHTAEAGHGRT